MAELKISKLDSNTPTFSGKSGERLDEWLFVLNTAFESLKVTNDKDHLKFATEYVKDAPLKALMEKIIEKIKFTQIGQGSKKSIRTKALRDANKDAVMPSAPSRFIAKVSKKV